MVAHPDKALTAMKVRQVSKPGRYADGHGLYLVVDPSGSKRWVQRLVVRGRRRDIGHGSARLVSLSEARELALEFRKIARTGGDPLEERRQVRNVTPTFAEAAKTVHELLLPTWKNEKAGRQWLTCLEDYAFPVIGSRAVDQIETPDVLKILTPIWTDKPETARRVRQRISKVMDWCKTAGYRSGENPVDGVTYGLPKQSRSRAHFKSLPYADVPAFIEQLRSGSGSSPISRLAFEFLILTAARTSEVRFAAWSEIDAKTGLWIVPSARMKSGREHRVPLGKRAVQILDKARQLHPDSALIFPNPNSGKPMSENIFLSLLKRMEVNATAHGFRSCFRDWIAETTDFSGELAEMALAHAIRDKTEASYRRGDLVEKRRAMMQAWEDFVSHSTG